MQVKSSWVLSRDGYRLTIRGVQKPYRRSDVDAFVAYVAPENAWYVIPLEKIGRLRTLCFYPHDRQCGGTFEKYRDCWHILGAISSRARCRKLGKPAGKASLAFRARQARAAWETLGAALFGG